MLSEIRLLWQVLPQKPVGVLVRPPLPRTDRVAEVDIDVGGDVGVIESCDQISLPVSGDRAILDLSGPIANRDGIDDLSA